MSYKIDKNKYNYQLLSEEIEYSPETGNFTCKKTGKTYQKYPRYGGSTVIVHKKQQLNAFVVAWVLQNMYFPPRRVGPLNGDYANTKWGNITLYWSNEELFGGDSNKELTLEMVKKLLVYNPDDGLFRARISFNRNPRGKVLSKMNNTGYNHVRLNNKNYNAARLAYWYITGEKLSPDKKLYRKNGLKTDDRWENLEVR